MTDTQVFVLWVLGILFIGFPIAVGVFGLLKAWADRIRDPAPVPLDVADTTTVAPHIRVSDGRPVYVSEYERKMP